MSRHGYSHGSGSDFGVDIGGGIAVLAVIVLYILFRMTVYIILTFVKYHKVAAKPLWYSFGVFVLLTVLGSLVAVLLNNQAPFGLEGIGFVQLFLTCVVVRRQYANTFMSSEGISMTEAVLKRAWWSDDTTPRAA
jgi:hypothetical protein